MVLLPVECPSCLDIVHAVKSGKTDSHKQRYMCQNPECKKKTFILDYSNRGCLKETKKKIIKMAFNGSGIRDTARVLQVSTSTVINELKKKKNTSIQ